MIQGTLKSSLPNATRAIAISVISDLVDIGLLDFELSHQFIQTVIKDEKDLAIQKELIRFESKVYTIYSNVDLNMQIDWLNKDSHSLETVKEIKDILEVLNPLVLKFLKGLEGPLTSEYLQALSNNKENLNWMFYLNYGLEF